MYELDEYDPFRPIRKMHRGMRDLFDFPELELEKSIREPLIDIMDKGKELELIAELPGVEKKDIKIKVLEDSLMLKAEAKSEEEKKKKGYYYHERSHNAFSRVIPLPTEVVPQKAKAEFKNGILTLTLAKKHPVEKRPQGHEVKIR